MSSVSLAFVSFLIHINPFIAPGTEILGFHNQIIVRSISWAFWIDQFAYSERKILTSDTARKFIARAQTSSTLL